jgi:Na+-transporting NADH:ubiquinone oxidoreductase subunit B
MSNSFFKPKDQNIKAKHQLFVRSWVVLFKRFFYSPENHTQNSPHIRSFENIQGLLNNFIIASIPCWLIGLWNLGYQSNSAMAQIDLKVISGWRGDLIAVLGIGYNSTDIFACLFHGLLYFIPIFLVALFIVSTWEVIFSTICRRPLSEGLLAFAWLFALVVPAGVELYKVCLSVSFGYVIGSAIFGGYGRYLTNPVLLSLAYLIFAYPNLVYNLSNWIPVPGIDTVLALKLAATGGISAVKSAGFSWWDLFFGIRPGPIGSVSVLGCLLGAVYLVLTNSASWRIMLSALLGLITAVMIYQWVASESNPMAALSASWHLVLGAFAFGVVFFATDPVASATTMGGRWVFGFLVGLLTVVIRVSNPSYNEGVLFAVLLASLFSPVIDFCFIELNIRRRKRRLMVVLNEAQNG